MADASDAGLRERQLLASDKLDGGWGATRCEASRNSWLKDTRPWPRSWQAKGVAVGVPILGALVFLGLLGVLWSRAACHSTQCLSDCKSEELRRAEQVYQENMLQRELVITTKGPDQGLEFLRKQYPVQKAVDFWFCPPYPCPDLMRIGQWGEGGKWVCRTQKQPNPNPIVISVGCNGDASFEQDMARRLNAFSHTFDFTLTPEQQQSIHALRFLKFHNAGVAGKAEVNDIKGKFESTFPNATILTVDKVMEWVNLKYIDVLKLDCEQCEYSFIQDVSELYSRETVPFGQILVEVHEVLDTRAKEVTQFVKSLESLGYRMFHSEVNPYYPAGFELSFIHESLVKP